MVSSFEETLPHDAFPGAAEYAVETARHKAMDIGALCCRPGQPRVDLIISADTVRACCA